MYELCSRQNWFALYWAHGVVCWYAEATDVSLEDSGNYTCEINGPLNSLLGSVTHYVFVRGGCIVLICSIIKSRLQFYSGLFYVSRHHRRH